jgi:hypothetical protein
MDFDASERLSQAPVKLGGFNPSLPVLLPFGAARIYAMEHYYDGGRIGGSVTRCAALDEPRGPGPSGESPLDAQMYPGDFVVHLDVPLEQVRERLRDWTGREK